MIYGEPQPYWTNSLIVTDTCNPEYAMPGTMPPILLFSALYSYHCIKDAPSLYSNNFKIYNGFMYFIYAIVCIFLYLTGSLFIYQWLLTTIYCVLSYKLALKLEEQIDRLLIKLTVQKMKAKKYVFLLAFTLLGLESLLTLIYNGSYEIPKVLWVKNYMNC